MYSNVDPAHADKDDNYPLIFDYCRPLLPVIDVVRKDHLQTGHPTPGVVRKRAFETEDIALSQTQLDAGRERCLPFRRLVFGQHRSEEHTSELQSQSNLVCRLLLEKKK